VPRDDTGRNRTLEVSCWSKEPREDELVGKGTIDITDTLQTGEFDGTSTLYDRISLLLIIFRLG
jgi:hypothetical protein